uniref:Transmembrane protein n=1 Tax=Vombatus ursinus TaxID=29139 RepID=A0A4X2JU11_VOMUR
VLSPRLADQFQQFMNHYASANSHAKPTCYKHTTNCYTCALCITPVIVNSALLHQLSDGCWERITAWIYGMGPCDLFTLSTMFHIVSWKKSHFQTMEHYFHTWGRMVIYFITSTYLAPWLNLHKLGPLASHMHWFIWFMAAEGTIYVFLHYEKYNGLSSFFYLTMGFSPPLVVTSMLWYADLKLVCQPLSINSMLLQILDLMWFTSSGEILLTSLAFMKT